MPITPEKSIYRADGIYITGICENYKKYFCDDSKRYLSGLLVGKRITHPNLLKWGIFTTNEFNIHPLAQTISMREIIEKLIKLKYLKPYDPEVKRQQAESRSKIIAGISAAIIIGLSAAFAACFALGLLGSFATLVGVIWFALAAGLTCCTIIPAFGEAIIDPECVKKYNIEEEKCQQRVEQIIASITTTSKAEIKNEEVAEQNNQATSVQQTSINPATNATTPTTNEDDDDCINKPRVVSL